MSEKVKKRYVGQRLDERLVVLFEQLVKKYPRLNMTDFIDMAMKYFVESFYDVPNELHAMLGRYLGGALDQKVERLYKEYLNASDKQAQSKEKKEPSKKTTK